MKGEKFISVNVLTEAVDFHQFGHSWCLFKFCNLRNVCNIIVLLLQLLLWHPVHPYFTSRDLNILTVTVRTICLVASVLLYKCLIFDTIIKFFPPFRPSVNHEVSSLLGLSSSPVYFNFS